VLAVATDMKVVGRESELGCLQEFVERVAERGGALLVRGEPGIGKTVLWRAGVAAAAAAGVHVLATSCAEQEMPLPFGSLGDLLDDLEGADDLPAAQRRVLAVAAGMEAPPERPPSELAVPRAFLDYVRSLARSRPLLLAVDDVLWLDVASQRTLAYVAKRLRGAPVGLLTTQRGLSGDPLDLRRAFDERSSELLVGPLSVGALHHLIRTRLGVRLPRRTVARVHAASGGNPMYAVEFAKATASATGPLPLPNTLDELVRERVARLPSHVVRFAAAVAACERPTLSLLTSVFDDAGALLDSASHEDVVRLDGDGVVRFAHPLLSSATYAAIPPSTRLDLHARLANATADEEQRARHHALAMVEADAVGARALDEAAVRARARGAPDAASELSRLAIQLTPPEDRDSRDERVIAAAGYLSDAGQIGAARTVVAELLSGSVSGARRGRALLLASTLEEDQMKAGGLAHEALELASDDAALRIQALLILSANPLELRDLAAAEKCARNALAEAERLGNPSLLAAALASLGAILDVGLRPEPELFERALALEARSPVVKGPLRPGMTLALLRLWAGRLRDARALLEAELDATYTEGDETLTQFVRLLFVALEWSEGNWDSAERRLVEHAERVFDDDNRPLEVHGLWHNALLAASRGRVEKARTFACEAIRTGEEARLDLFAVLGRWVLGFLALSRDRPEDAWETLRLMPGTEHPRHIWLLPDAIEAAVAVGELDEAESRLTMVEQYARARTHRWAEAAALRSRALVLLARGDAQEALASAEAAAAAFESLGFPLDHARALLASGEACRRLGERRRAAERLAAARDVFARLGAPLWLARAERELRRANPRPRRDGELTAAERRVAALVAHGRTNREVAAQLFTTVGTVEVHLTRIYRKLDVRSRTELARRVADGSVEVDDA
jgi:DNA-binding NarL/FixJ family response regulator